METERGATVPEGARGRGDGTRTGAPVVTVLFRTLLVVGDLTSLGTEECIHCTANYTSTETLPFSVSPPASPNMTYIQAVILCSAIV